MGATCASGYGTKTVCSQTDCGRSSRSRRSGTPSQRNPDTQEPETPVVEVLVVDRLHPSPVVVERLMVEAALIDPAPGEVRWRRPPLRATRATVITGSAAWSARAAESAVIIGSTARPTVGIGPTGPTVVIGPTRPPGPWQLPPCGPQGGGPGSAPATPTPMWRAWGAWHPSCRGSSPWDHPPTAARHVPKLCDGFSPRVSDVRDGCNCWDPGAGRQRSWSACRPSTTRPTCGDQGNSHHRRPTGGASIRSRPPASAADGRRGAQNH